MKGKLLLKLIKKPTKERLKIWFISWKVRSNYDLIR